MEPRAVAGVYAIICNITGAMYIGSSIDIRIRLVQHLVINNTNEHLQNAIAKYGLENFTFAVVEFYDLEVLLQREQHYLDILFPPAPFSPSKRSRGKPTFSPSNVLGENQCVGNRGWGKTKHSSSC